MAVLFPSVSAHPERRALGLALAFIFGGGLVPTLAQDDPTTMTAEVRVSKPVEVTVWNRPLVQTSSPIDRMSSRALLFLTTPSRIT